MKFSIYQESRRGQRPNNEDRMSYCYTRDALLMVVADGMGGHLHGEIAAQIAVQYITEAFQQAAKPNVGDEIFFLSRALANAHNAILDYAFDKYLPEPPRTTIVACVIQNNQAFWAHAGDSRLYLLRDGNVLHQTRDHSRVQVLLDQGLLNEEEAENHPARNRIFSCLGGTHSPQIDFSRGVPLYANDVLILCTDGVWGNLNSQLISDTLRGDDLEKVTRNLLDVAEKTGGETCDNLSTVVARWYDDYTDESASISTDMMPLDSFTTQMEGFARGRNPQEGASNLNLTDDDIERAIEEINNAISRISKLDSK